MWISLNVNFAKIWAHFGRSEFGAVKTWNGPTAGLFNLHETWKVATVRNMRNLSSRDKGSEKKQLKSKHRAWLLAGPTFPSPRPDDLPDPTIGS
ncbi:hypothetical protein CGCF415_v006124 [Colletotrichum fructicola]|nr:hypothetical protein CGCFRS4_v012306 [Colletotrichum fructicola]KAF4909138.1 hypothetical protein CGCF415_v006124 [Colletotrichum fructicola]KAF4928204.1 hypothetical protein CGCF245_v012756 [Colletotrichum fructicola]